MLIRLFRAALCVGLLLLLYAGKVFAAGILVLAPHPDDDVLIAAGVVSNAHNQGKSVKIVYVTNGDINGTSQGYFREAEAVTGQSYLGTAENDLIFLGYPDSHLQEIYDSYTSSSDRWPVRDLWQSRPWSARLPHI